MKVKHGGERRAFSEKFGIPEEQILDFSSSINPWGPPASVVEAYRAGVKDLAYYPDSEALEFRREVARHYPIFPENVIAGNGAVELLDLALRFLAPKRTLLIEPTFLEYRRILNLLGSEVRSLFLREGNDFTFPVREIRNALQGVDVAVFANPNNPTGMGLSKEDLQPILSEAKRRNIFVILDEAFVDWVNELSFAGELRDDSFFFIIRSLTKFFALPGIRIGYGLGSRKLIEKLRSSQVPWSCNRLAQRLGVAALRDETFQSESRARIAAEREFLKTELARAPSLKTYPSLANFLLIRDGSQTWAKEGGSRESSLFEAMGRQGIYLRDLSEMPGLGPSFFRVAVRQREENARLIEALRHHTASQKAGSSLKAASA